ncbi:hypothetical protein T552_03171 [Pneumocystis carinii B80]|uniref:Transcription factor Iwr1 domain-containing protein n=1 Tax=Pneumocystis carinii (strain B80) TaxID=1408658 RepID=A0A0W4ZBY8_PNEC8|nr:hypothetical protein T552_03171 [Pneumocystis carinii B80]KTW25897.1 hypothetical protein T552_03171 [Pneumocystis carinii B80]
MLRIKRKREEEAVALLYVTKESIPLKRRKQGNNFYMLFETLELESVGKFEEEQEKQTIETSNEQEEELRQNEANISKRDKYRELIHESSEENYVYDMYVPLVYTPDTSQTNSMCFGVVTLEDNDISFFEETDSYDQYDNDEDSNAEDFYQNSYPDEDEWPNSDIEEREI